MAFPAAELVWAGGGGAGGSGIWRRGAHLLHRGSMAKVADPVIGAVHLQRSPGGCGKREEAAERLD